MCTPSEATPTSIWASTLGNTTAVNNMNMFRAWRGSMRYTIIVEEAKDPVYVSLIPHSGTLVVGYHEIFPNMGGKGPIHC